MPPGRDAVSYIYREITSHLLKMESSSYRLKARKCLSFTISSPRCQEGKHPDESIACDGGRPRRRRADRGAYLVRADEEGGSRSWRRDGGQHLSPRALPGT